ncbi:hypothetical protein L6164_025466 [Bauhinia variegata]|uniref:Uncharacterized protein n=1 Tax=Bauhinia variegata TaxID=167791 RepID=A0ACB9M0K9_BAUVA|nr:hypothetical protein L6164_025466 [Bauhinia variegata]
MEVDPVQVTDHVNHIVDEADEQSLSPENSSSYNVFGEPQILPRVGDEFQVEASPLISKSEYCWFQKNLSDKECTGGTPHDFGVGLPIPLNWIKDELKNNNNAPQGVACKSVGVANKNKSSKQECVKETHNIKLEESEESTAQQEIRTKVHEKHKGKGYSLVPGSSSDTWNEIEEASLILGLYIFGKDLVQLKRFIGNKKMGDILSFYYGKFYRSDRYRRWSECKKMKSRKCIYGQKIFTGARQHELLSRLQPILSEECRSTLLEASKTFSEGKMCLEDYVMTLKVSVGLNALVEAVGVGKGKEDLTGLTTDSLKSAQAHSVRPEIPVGKAWSMLTSSEIKKFLTGDYRLSKARSNDLFWEAVWPRLLARGWHSEQPSCYNYALASSNSLVFLLPGVKKFSRKLVKGNQYFDSVSDVLGKVASDPELIELEAVADNDCPNKEGNEWTKTKMDQESSLDLQRHCYLKPRTPNHSSDGMKFTVVDTTLTSEKMGMVRELRSLPVGVLKASTYENDSEEDDDDTSEDQTNESDSVNAMCFDREKSDITKAANKINIRKPVSSDKNGLKNNPLPDELPMSVTNSTGLSVASKDHKADFLNNTHRKNALKRQSSQRMASDNKNVLVPVTKRRRRLTACSRAEKNCNTANSFVAPKVKPEEPTLCADSPKSTRNVHLSENPPKKNKTFADPPPRENKMLAPPSNPCSIVSREAVPIVSPSASVDQGEKPQPRTLIDLNLPVTMEFETEEPCVTEMTETQQNNTRNEADGHSAGTISIPVDNSEHQPDMNTRRQSTRNRPLTTKVLEAFAFGYLDRKEKRRSWDSPRDSSRSRSSRRARVKATGESSSSSGADLQKEESANGVSNDTDSDNVMQRGSCLNEGASSQVPGSASK